MNKVFKYQFILFFTIIPAIYVPLIAQQDMGEPNDTQSQAYVINPTVNLDATIGFQSDAEDWYSVTFPENGTFTYTVVNTSASIYQANSSIGDISLYDAC